jgi:hypothetical protein
MFIRALVTIPIGGMMRKMLNYDFAKVSSKYASRMV